MSKIYGYVVDKNKKGSCRIGSDDSYIILGSKKGFFKSFKPGEFISRDTLKIVCPTKSEIDDLLIPVSIDECDLKNYGSRRFPVYGKKYTIVKSSGYIPNRFNVNRYK